MTKIILSPQVTKQLSKLNKSDLKKINKRLYQLKESPLIGKKLQGKLKNFYTLRAWPYRIIYQIITNKDALEIITIAHRQSVYK